MSSNVLQGVVLRFMSDRGFGFLYSDKLKRRVFFHVSNFNRATDPIVGEPVTFDLAPSHKSGMPDAAVNVNPVAGVS